jgi:hypothetical protein
MSTLNRRNRCCCGIGQSQSASPGDALEALRARIYPDPDGFESAEAFERLHHDDVPRLTLRRVDAERILGRLRWALTVVRDEETGRWLEERLALLDQAAARLRKSERPRQ